MTPQLEKVFFNYVLQYKKYFDIVKPHFFRNSQIQFVYGVLRNYILAQSDSKIPTARQILDMVSLEDKEGQITKEILKSILQVKLSEYDEKNFLEPKFNAWVLSNRLKTGTVDIIEETRNLDQISDFDKAIEAADRIKSIVDEMSSTNFVQDDDMGSDFDDPENHVQDSSKFKIKSGFETLDHMLGGGWDIQTLNCIMAETNNGKCCHFVSKIVLKNKKNDKMSIRDFGTLFSEISKGDYNLLSGKYDRPLYDKFIEAYEVKDLQVLTPNGWVDIEGIGKTVEYDEWLIQTSGGKELICADEHLVYRCDNLNFSDKKCDLTELYTKDLRCSDFIMTKDGPEMIMDIRLTGQKSHMYDLQLSSGSNKQYYTNDILSHNSLWMQNFAFKSADAGYNVLYITLEMSERKVMKRLGAMRLKIPINDYDAVSKDSEMINKRIKSLGSIKEGGDIFDKKVGKIFSKFWAAGTATVSDFDYYLQKLRDKKDIKIDLIIVDYITLVAAPKGLGGDNLYSKGKSLAEGLRALGAKYKCPVITGVQVAKDAWNSSDITLESVPESKAIAETADTFFAIIRTEEMKRQNIYRFKLLKQRDGDFLKSQIRLNLNPTYLTLENDQFLDQ